MGTIPEDTPEKLLAELQAHVEEYEKHGDRFIGVQLDDWVREWRAIRWRWVHSVGQRGKWRKKFLDLAKLHVSERAMALFAELQRQLMAACDAVAAPDGLRHWARVDSHPWCCREVPITGAIRAMLDDVGIEGPHGGAGLARALREFNAEQNYAGGDAFENALAGVLEAVRNLDALLFQAREGKLWQAAHYCLCVYHAYAPDGVRDVTLVYNVEGMALAPTGQPWDQYLAASGRMDSENFEGPDSTMRDARGGFPGLVKRSLRYMEALTDYLKEGEGAQAAADGRAVKALVTPPHPTGGQWTETELYILEALHYAYHTQESLAKAIKKPFPTVRDALRKGKPLRRYVDNERGLGYYRKDARPDLEA
jgi:hypothetical protein